MWGRFVVAGRLLEGGALRGLDPGSVGVGELERHDTGAPALGLGLVDARAERRGVDEPVRGISSRAGLANDELVQVDAVGRDLEHGRAGEGTARRVEETLAVGVEALVVELDVVLQAETVSDKEPHETDRWGDAPNR